jgi:glycosyltransferase involved in cell wall biosynthesis
MARCGGVGVRVVHVITKGDVGGAQTHVVELAAAQIGVGLQVTVVAGTAGAALDRCRSVGCDVRVVASLGEARARLGQRGALRDLEAAIVASRPDIVHAHSSNAGFLARLVCRRRKIACVYTAHGWPFQRGAAWSQRLLSFGGEFVAGHLGAGVICLTDAEAERARRARVVPADRLWVVPNGLADVADELVRRSADSPPSVVMVARFAPPKLQREVVDVMATLTGLAWTLTFVGDGPELAACRQHAASVLGDRAAFLGHRDDVTELLAGHDTLVLWSAYEGLPISVLEGMRAGMCCVASDLPGVRELLGDDAGVVVDTSDVLRRALAALLVDPARRAALGAAARAAFVERYSISGVESRIRSIYAELIARR